MPQTSLMPPVKTQFLDNNGKPAAGGKVYTWMAGTSNTAKATYTDSTGETENANPVTLDTNGRAAIWLSGYYHIQAYDALGNLIADADNVSSMPNTVVSQSQWVPQNITLTFVDGDNFSTPGILTDTFAVGQRVKATVSAGDIYGTVSNSTAGGSPVVTTVTVTWDSGELDSGLSAVWTGILTPGNPSIPGGVTLSDLQKLHALTPSASDINVLKLSSREIGDIITKSSSDVLGAIAAVAAGNYLKSAGVAALPSYGKLSLVDTGVYVHSGEYVNDVAADTVTTGFRPSLIICGAMGAKTIGERGWSFGAYDRTQNINRCIYRDPDGSAGTGTVLFSITSCGGGFVNGTSATGYTVTYNVAERIYFVQIAFP